MHANACGALRRRHRCRGTNRSRPSGGTWCSFVVGTRVRLRGHLAEHHAAGAYPRFDHNGYRAMTTYGVMFGREWPADKLIEYARLVEAHDLDEMWMVEDLTFHGGFTQATAALAATNRI